jgi:hypothetical protein
MSVSLFFVDRLPRPVLHFSGIISFSGATKSIFCDIVEPSQLGRERCLRSRSQSCTGLQRLYQVKNLAELLLTLLNFRALSSESADLECAKFQKTLHAALDEYTSALQKQLSSLHSFYLSNNLESNKPV